MNRKAKDINLSPEQEEKVNSAAEKIFTSFGANESSLHKSVSEDLKHAFNTDIKFIEQQIVYYQTKLADPSLDDRTKSFYEKQLSEYEMKRTKAQNNYSDRVEKEATESRTQHGRAMSTILTIVSAIGTVGGVAADLRYNDGKFIKSIPKLTGKIGLLFKK